jgi:phosphotransferase system IIB component
VSSRLLIEVRDDSAVDEVKLGASGYRGATRVAANQWHVIVGPGAATAAATLSA